MDSDPNKVYGILAAPRGLEPVLRAVETLVSDDGRASIYRSGFDGAETLKFDTDLCDFESMPLEGCEHLFNGKVGGSLDEVLAFVCSLSLALTEAGVGHRFEIYDDRRQLVQIIPS